MAQSYKQIQKQIEALQLQAEKLRKHEIDTVVARIKAAIAHYGLTAEQLGFDGTAKGARTKLKAGKSAPAVSAKYSDAPGKLVVRDGKAPVLAA